MSITPTRITSLREQLRQAGRRFCAAAHALEAPARELADLEAQLRTAETAAGLPAAPTPPARELAADVLQHCTGALRPFQPHTSAVAAERAEAALTTRPPKAADLSGDPT